jgi:hypothetical protein
VSEQSGVQVDWTNDEAVVRAAFGEVTLPLEMSMWLGGPPLIATNAWQHARQHYAQVIEFERQYNPDFASKLQTPPAAPEESTGARPPSFDAALRGLQKTITERDATIAALSAPKARTYEDGVRDAAAKAQQHAQQRRNPILKLSRRDKEVFQRLAIQCELVEAEILSLLETTQKEGAA